MMSGIFTIIGCFLIPLVAATAKQNGSPHTTASYYPVAYYIGQESPSKAVGFQGCKSASPYILNTSSPVLSLDYGTEVAGSPYVEISALDGEYAQIEMKYTEPYEGLSLPYGDGPWY